MVVEAARADGGTEEGSSPQEGSEEGVTTAAEALLLEKAREWRGRKVSNHGDGAAYRLAGELVAACAAAAADDAAPR